MPHALTTVFFDRILSSSSLRCLPSIPHHPHLRNRRFFATQLHPFDRDAERDETPVLPRFLRRQKLQKSSTSKSHDFLPKRKPQSLTPSANPVPTFRSRHYNPSEVKPKEVAHFLEPHVLSQRIKKLCEAAKFEDAVLMVKNAPLDAQNTQVWNSLIWESLKEKRYQTAYRLFIDMKRRGFSPTTRTFQTFFNGFARIENWSIYTKQLANARSLYQSFQHHITSIKKYNPNDPNLSVDALGGYIRTLGNAGEYQELFDVYYALDQDGPLAPNQLIFTSMFQAIVAAKTDTTEGSVKVAADARLLWTQLSKLSLRNPNIAPDSHTVVSAISALSGGNEMDQALAFQIIAQYFGLEAGKSVSSQGLFPLQPESLGAIFKFCILTRNYDKCSQFFQQVKKRPANMGGMNIIDRGHMEDVLKAELALRKSNVGYHALEKLMWMLRKETTGSNGLKCLPTHSTYILVIQACLQSGDWNAALRTFELMTGYHAHDFMDGAVAEIPRIDNRGSGKNITPTAEFISWMVRTAIATKNRTDIRQALRIVDHLDFEGLLRIRETGKEPSKSVKSKSFLAGKFASSVLNAADFLVAENGKYSRPEDLGKWEMLGKLAKNYLEKNSMPTMPHLRKF